MTGKFNSSPKAKSDFLCCTKKMYQPKNGSVSIGLLTPSQGLTILTCKLYQLRGLADSLKSVTILSIRCYKNHTLNWP